jgi:hypothetical protein
MGLTFKHSGRLGDIIYSMPLVQEMAVFQGKPVDYYVCNDVPARLGKDVFHPSLEVMVNAKLFDYIEPLLSTQHYIRKILHVPIVELPPGALDLDRFKTSGLNLKAGLIYGWYRKAFGVSFPVEAPWLFVDKQSGMSSSQDHLEVSVLIGRTTRFCNTKINYSFLDQIENVGFIGLDYEYQDFISRHALVKVRHIKVNNALELAILMSRAKIFIGNQSLNFAIAEGLKVPRALEAFEPVPVASPVGGLCFEYINTQYLVNFLSKVLQLELMVPADIVEGDYCESIKAQIGYVVPFKQRIKNFLRGPKKSRY